MSKVCFVACVCVACFLPQITGQKGYFTEVPVNTAAAIGTSAQLNCSANLSPSASGSEDVVEWRHYIHDSTGSRIYVSSTGEIFDSRYDVKTTSSGGYHLVIKSASADVGGQYLCWLFNAYSKAPCEFVAVSGPTCSPEPGVKEVEAGVIVLMTCEAEFYGYREPDLQWSSELGSHLGTVTVIDNKVTHVMNVTASNQHDQAEFSCRLLFNKRSSETSDPPTYTSGCSTNFRVLFGATRVRVMPDPDNEPGGILTLNEGDVINCTADGNPEPSYHWEGPESEYILGSQLVIADHMADGQIKTYTCYAENVINKIPRTASKEVRFAAENVAPTEAPQSSTLMAAGAIAGIVIVSLAVVVTIVVVIILLIRKRAGEKAANESGPPPPYTRPSQQAYTAVQQRPTEVTTAAAKQQRRPPPVETQTSRDASLHLLADETTPVTRGANSSANTTNRSFEQLPTTIDFSGRSQSHVSVASSSGHLRSNDDESVFVSDRSYSEDVPPGANRSYVRPATNLANFNLTSEV